MTYRCCLLSLCLPCMFWVSSPLAEDAPECKPIKKTFIPRNVFDRDADNYYWIHEFGNSIHETTRKDTLSRAMNAFRQCHSDIDPYEIERYLRRLSYIRDAKVEKVSHQGKKDELIIETWDNWTLQPNLSFGRKGGENTFSLGVSEGNILGTGIAANFNFFSNQDRSGYVFGADTPIQLGYLLDTSFLISNNDDGYSQVFSVESPFVSKDTPWASSAVFKNTVRHSGVRKRDGESIKVEENIRFSSLWWGWSTGSSEKTAARHRYRIGFTSDKHQFFQLIDEDLLPEDREYSYPWFQYSFLSNKYTKMQNIYLINTVEDINLGINFWLKAGMDLSPSKSEVPAIWSGSFSKATRMSENWLFNFLINAEGNGLDNGSNRFVVDSLSEFFYTPHKLFTLYGKLIFTLSENDYLESPVTLGDNTGLTGYPLQYSQGDHFWVYQEELRYYPRINIFQLLELSGAIFYGAGKTFGGGNKANNNKLLQTVGFGVRFYSTRSSKGNTLYLDFARPISTDSSLNKWEWRLRGKSQF